MQTKQDVLQACTVQGNVIKLPPVQLERKLYQDVSKSLELIGGKWKGNKIQGFVFSENPTELLAQIANGETRNLKKEFQFFSTPELLADRLVSYSNIEQRNRILEPSAGQGAIVKSIFKAHSFVKQIDCCELMPLNETFLNKIDGTLMISNDFLQLSTNYYNYYDRIIANPPFSNNQDIDHITKMYLCCKAGGKIVSIASKHWQRSSNKKEQQFKIWLNEVQAEIIEIEAGEFKESGTAISTVIIIINK